MRISRLDELSFIIIELNQIKLNIIPISIICSG